MGALCTNSTTTSAATSRRAELAHSRAHSGTAVEPRVKPRVGASQQTPGAKASRSPALSLSITTIYRVTTQKKEWKSLGARCRLRSNLTVFFSVRRKSWESCAALRRASSCSSTSVPPELATQPITGARRSGAQEHTGAGAAVVRRGGQARSADAG